MPAHIVPMLARLSKLPANEDDWGFEVKWDGIRALLYSGKRKGEITLENRNLRDITFKYPELHPLAGLNAVIDGEIVALDDAGRPSFERLQARMHLSTEAAVSARMKDVPVRLMAFDLIWHDGSDLTGLPYTERRAGLEALDLNADCWQTPGWRRGEGSALLQAAKDQALEYDQSFFKILKDYTLAGYFLSETGATRALAYEAVPGGYWGDLPLAPDQKAWAI